MKRLLGLIVLGAAFTGCGGGGADVLVKGFRFQPKEITVAVGSSVTWKQQDNTLHTLTAGTPGKESGVFDHRDFGQGNEFSFTFEESGTFPYFCANHPEGMRGTVRVR